MQRKEIEKVYIKKINELRKHDEAYFEQDSPIITDKDYDIIKKEIINLDNDITILIIAHRLSTLKNCSQLIEIADGKVKRQGSYKDIISNNV